MTEKADISDAMINAALRIVPAGLINRRDASRMIAAALAELTYAGPTAVYPLWVNAPVGTKRARFLGATERRCYYRVETSEGKELTLHANDILAAAKGQR